MGPFITGHSFHFRHPLKRQHVHLNDFLSLLFLLVSLQWCTAQETSRVRLVNGATPNEGRVEVDIDDGRGWGTICDNGWDYNDASVVCKQLGYPAATYSTMGARYGGNPTLPVLLENVACTPSHTAIDECPSANPSASCDHTNDAGVKCMIPGFLGCFSLLTIGSRAWTILENSNDVCIAHCKDLDYRYAGMSGSSCRCGNNNRYYFYNQYPDFYCNSNCKGDSTQLCGNSVHSYFSVFDTTLGVCEDPRIPQNGNRSGDNFSFAATVSFSCNGDHVLIGDPILQCVLGDSPHDVKWNGTLPECVRSAASTSSTPGIVNSITSDVTMEFMTSSDNPITMESNQTLSSGAIAGIAVVMVMIVISFIIITVLYVVKQKREAKTRAAEFQPEAINQKTDSIDNVYEIDESNVMENETDLAPSPSNGHTIDTRDHAGNIGNGHTPRPLPSIHLYADVTIPREDLISPTSDYGTVDDVSEGDGEDLTPRIPGDSVDGGTQHQDRHKRFYFVLENAVAKDHSDKGQLPKQKPQVKAPTPAGRFIKKPPRNAPKNLKTIKNQDTSATNVLHRNFGLEYSSSSISQSERENNLPGEGAVEEQTDTSFQNEPKSPKYVNSEFHEVPKNLLENTLYKPADLKSKEVVGSKEKLSVPNLKTRVRNNSESEVTPKSPQYANSDHKRRRSTGEPESTGIRYDQDNDVKSPCYINSEFHAVPDNMIDNQLYKPCKPGQIGVFTNDNSSPKH